MADLPLNSELVSIEFLGLPKLRTGVAFCFVNQGSLASILEQLALLYPKLAELLEPSHGGKSHLLFSINGEYFIRDTNTLVLSGQQLLVLSADAGG